MQKNKFLLTGNGSYENKGCEAIVRGTISILDNAFDNNIYNIETCFESEESYVKQKNSEFDERITHIKATKERLNFFAKPSLKTFETALSNRFKILGLFENLKFQKQDHKNILDDLTNCKAALCVGGDNYSFDYGVPKFFTDTDDVILSYNKPCIIWGASIGPFSKYPIYEKNMAKHLRKITGIFVREDKSLEYLDSIGVKDNVYRVSDPAFVMEPIKPANFDTLVDLDSSIGINLSPMMAKFWTDSNMDRWSEFCINLIKKVSNKIKRPIYLVPHVVHPNINNDYVFLKNIKDQLNDLSENVYLLGPNYSAAEIKFIISKMACFMGARTHSTIAAFSSLVPTISLVYSIKALGINKEVYGDTSFCVTKDNIDNIDYIADLLNSVLADTPSIKTNINNNLIKIKQRAVESGNILVKITD
ncbi:MAG: polysaccharide pyruvyl transferase family protein [Candidatus Gastranaerophilales bacterium]|nr:polysaccharide pyruvyl transferase family protein [Candidatus Gastranaerophilales bacterium]